MAENVGGIVYSVDIETAKTVSATKAINKELDSLQKGMDNADKSAGQLGGGMNKVAAGVRRARDEASPAAAAFSKMGAALIAAVSVRAVMSVIATADAYGEMSERIGMATESVEEFEMVQRRLLASANATYRPLAEAQELFVRTADTLRSLGYTTSQAIDITDSFSLALVRNAASGARAESAISAMSKSFQSGRVAADQWESILTAIPTVVDDIAKATGKTATDIRALGVAGELTGFQLSEGLRKGRDENAQAAADMAVTVKDAYNNLINTLTVYIGEANKASGASHGLAKAMEAITNGFRFTVGMLTDQEKLNTLFAERQKIVDSLASSEGTWRANMPGAVALREKLKGIEAEMLAIQEKRIAEQKEEGATPTEGPAQTTSASGQKALADMRKAAELAALQGEARAKLSAIQRLGSEATAEERAEAEKLASEIYRLEEAQKAAGTATTSAAAAAKKAAAQNVKNAEENAAVLMALKEAIYQAGLSASDLAQRQAELRLNPYATPEQIAQVRALAAELQQITELEQKRKAFGSTEKEIKTKITGQVDPLSGGMFDDQTARYEAEAEAERVRYQAQIDRLKEAKALQLEVAGGYYQLEQDLAQQHADRLEQIEAAKNQTMLAAGQQTFDALAAATASFAGEQSGLYKVMFAASKAFAIAQSLVAIQQGIAMAAANPWPVNLGAMASVAAATASIVGNIGSVAMSGRALGGPVQANEMYRVNETGSPEIFNAANGRQYMMPNQRGEVVSNKDASAGTGEPTVIVNIQNNAEGSTATATSRTDNRQTIIDVVVSDIMTNGKIGQATNRVTGTKRAGG